jgi:capsular exopolysaccharide synthesis family protein
MARSQEHAQLTLRDYASVIRRRKWIVIYPMLLTAIVAGILSGLAPVKYRATAEVLVQLPPTAENVGSTGAVMSPRLIENELRAASGSELQAEVRQIVGPEPLLSVAADESSDVFRFTAVSGGKRQSADAANAYAMQYIERQRSALISEYTARAAVIDTQLQTALADGDDLIQIAEYEQELESLDVSIELARTSGSTLIDEATPPGAPFEPQTRRTVAFALMLGLLIGLGTAFLLEYIDTSIRDEDELAAASGLPTLAVVPDEDFDDVDGRFPIVTRDHPHSSASEAYRGLRTAVQFIALDRTLKVVQLTSPRPGEGKTTTAANLAIAAARGGQRVVLVDCDLRKPQINACFGLGNETGFTSVLLRKATLQAAVVSAPDEPRLRILPSGPIPPNPSELLASDRARAIVQALADAVDLVVIDSPPVLPVADSVSISGLADGVVIVAAAESTDRRTISKTIDRFEQVEAPLIGTVLNRADPRQSIEYRYEYAPDEPAETDEPASEPDSDSARVTL